MTRKPSSTHPDLVPSNTGALSLDNDELPDEATHDRPRSAADPVTELSAPSSRHSPACAGDEPPVVARLIVEIRSDGSRTIARGAMEDVLSGQRVAVEARGDSPMQLAWGLARSILKAPALARSTVRALLPGRRNLIARK